MLLFPTILIIVGFGKMAFFIKGFDIALILAQAIIANQAST